MSAILGLIECTSNKIKQKTINFVTVLRKHSLPPTLEAEIEGYLTDVLDQMDILQTVNEENPTKTIHINEVEGSLSFSQLEKPRGDQEEVHF